jgi:hypothetical protein
MKFFVPMARRLLGEERDCKVASSPRGDGLTRVSRPQTVQLRTLGAQPPM